MATIYKRGGKDNKGGKWYIKYYDENGVRRTVRGAPDRQVTLQIARKLESDVALRKAGVLDPKTERYVAEGRKSVEQHLEDWKREMSQRGVTEKQVRLSFSRAKNVLELARIERLTDITPSAIRDAISILREKGRAAKTLNDTLASVKQFCSWLRKDGRISENPIGYLERFNTAVDRRHDRRALTDDEIVRLIRATERGRDLQHCPGPERALIYRLAILTGLRANEIGTLTKGAFELDGSPSTVTVQAAFSKHRRKDVQPLPEELVPLLREHLADKKDEDLAFTMPKRPIEALRIDLRNAEVEYETRAGFADFHALRHTFITRMVKAGVNPKTAQTLARHHDAGMTLNVYSHVELIDQAGALRTIPKLDVSGEGSERTKQATGTDGRKKPEKILADTSRNSECT